MIEPQAIIDYTAAISFSVLLAGLVVLVLMHFYRHFSESKKP